ncbi:MAG: hypothetical protein J6C28_01060 [Bacilli bacterium]|nr:hypothetical protein [Bacilli bacterium]
MGKIKVKVGPKAFKMFTTFITSAALYDGPSELETTKTNVIHNETTNETYVEVEPQTVVINKSVSQRLAGRVARFLMEHVELEKKSQAK